MTSNGQHVGLAGGGVWGVHSRRIF